MKKRVVSIVALVLSVLMLSGCSALQTALQRLKGELVGESYTIYSYDNFGNQTFSLSGDHIAMEAELDEAGEISSYVDITVDGEPWQHVGGTLLFLQDGVDVITDFQIPEEMETDKSSMGLVAADKFVNHYKNMFGDEKVILLSSQTGTPICLLQGDDVYTTIPADLPKTTLVNIDDKMVYIHRGNVDIFSADLFE